MDAQTLHQHARLTPMQAAMEQEFYGWLWIMVVLVGLIAVLRWR